MNPNTSPSLEQDDGRYGNVVRLLRLLVVPGIGPRRARALLRRFGSADEVLGASCEALERAPGVGPKLAATIARHASRADELAEEELSAATARDVQLIGEGDPGYPALFEGLDDAPLVLYARGDIGLLRKPCVAIVGSRRCTSYGIEQAERFAGVLAQTGFTVVSGGARGIDTASHRAAARAGGATAVVQGCGLARAYPPENWELFDRLVSDQRGVILSELPMTTPPNAENFPARNRIISALSLGVIVIEAGRKSGALITARVAAEDHGREVLVVPGRVDSTASEGCLDLLKAGGGLLVSDPADVLEALDAPLRHLSLGVHSDRYSGSGRGLELPIDAGGDDPVRGAVLAALEEPMSMDALLAATRLEAGEVRAAVTVLEMTGELSRRGGLLERGRRSTSDARRIYGV